MSLIWIEINTSEMKYLSYKLPVYFPSVIKPGKLIIEQCCAEINWRRGKNVITWRIK